MTYEIMESSSYSNENTENVEKITSLLTDPKTLSTHQRTFHRKKKVGSSNRFGLKLKTKQRDDVVLKSILRYLRRYYLQKFNELTNYLSKKKVQTDDKYYLIRSLFSFVK